MRVWIPEPYYSEARDVAHAQGISIARLICESLRRPLGMEGIPLPDCEVWGEEDNKKECPP